MHERQTLRLTLLAATTLWVAAIIAAPLFDLGWVYALFARICHQLPARTWFVGGEPLAACIRCTSIYFGFLLALALRVPATPWLLRLGIGMTLAEFAAARAGLDYEIARALSGLLVGGAAAGFVELGIRQLWVDRIARNTAYLEEKPGQ